MASVTTRDAVDTGDRHIRVARANSSKRRHSKREPGRFPTEGPAAPRSEVLSSMCSQGMLLLSIGCLCSRGIFYTQIPSPDKNRLARDTRHCCSHHSPGGSCQEPLVGGPDRACSKPNPRLQFLSPSGPAAPAHRRPPPASRDSFLLTSSPLLRCP